MTAFVPENGVAEGHIGNGAAAGPPLPPPPNIPFVIAITLNDSAATATPTTRNTSVLPATSACRGLPRDVMNKNPEYKLTATAAIATNHANQFTAFTIVFPKLSAVTMPVVVMVVPLVDTDPPNNALPSGGAACA